METGEDALFPCLALHIASLFEDDAPRAGKPCIVERLGNEKGQEGIGFLLIARKQTSDRVFSILIILILPTAPDKSKETMQTRCQLAPSGLIDCWIILPSF